MSNINKPINLFWTTAIVLLLATSVGFSLYLYFNSPKIAYVRIDAIFNAFELKKELEGSLQSETNAQKAALDSLALLYEFERTKQNPPTPVTEQKLGALREELNTRKNFLDNVVSERKEKYDAQIQTQLVQYLVDFSKKEGIEILFTTLNGSTLIYGDERLDLTEQATSFVNAQYLGQ